MFDHIGSKLRGLAKLLCLVGILISVVAMITVWITGGGLSGRGSGFSVFVFGLLTGGLGSLASWVMALMTYGFGQLIEDTEAIRHDVEDLQYSADSLRRMGEARRRSSEQNKRPPEQAA